MHNQNITLLAIESSCDDTSAAIIKNGKICSNVINNQKVHEEYGGVVPELASRAHQQNIIPVVEAAFKRASVSKDEIDAVAFTSGPGLIGSLLVGTSFAKGFALAQNIPLINVHHMKAHIAAHYIENPKMEFPFLCLTVSGGHTQIVLVKDYLDMEVVGSTIDDAAGEAFDKAAKMLGFPYPGGPLIDKFAKEGNANAFTFAKPKIEHLDFSFSGVKTSILYFLEKQKRNNPNFIEENKNDLCASIQNRIVSILMKKLLKASDIYNIKNIAIAGGVSANSLLRSEINALEEKGFSTFIPKFEYCLDNAAMIAMVGYHKYIAKEFTSHSIEPVARWKME